MSRVTHEIDQNELTSIEAWLRILPTLSPGDVGLACVWAQVILFGTRDVIACDPCAARLDDQVVLGAGWSLRRMTITALAKHLRESTGPHELTVAVAAGAVRVTEDVDR